MASVETKPITAEEFIELPDPKDGSKLELVKGEIVAMPPTGYEHGQVQANVAFLIMAFLKTNPIGRVVIESGVITERGPDTVRGPDISYYSIEKVPRDRRIVGYHELPPDLCVEVLSPSNTKKQLRDKIKEYFTAGVRMVWVVDPDDRTVTVLTSLNPGHPLREPSELDGGDVLPGFKCQVSELFQ